MGVCFTACWFRSSVDCAWCDTAAGFHLPHYRSTKSKWRLHITINSMTIRHGLTYIGKILWIHPFRVDPGNRIPRDMFYLKHLQIFINVPIGKSTSCLLNLWISAFVPPLSKRCCRCTAWGGRMWGSCDRMDIALPTQQLMFVARSILTSQLRPRNQAILAWLWIFVNTTIDVRNGNREILTDVMNT